MSNILIGLFESAGEDKHQIAQSWANKYPPKELASTIEDLEAEYTKRFGSLGDHQFSGGTSYDEGKELYNRIRKSKQILDIINSSSQDPLKESDTQVSSPSVQVKSLIDKLNKRELTRISNGLQKALGTTQQGVAEGSEESYIIVRTNSEGKKDVFAGNFDTYERAQKELDACLAHPLHTKYKQKFEIKRKGQQGVAEGDDIGYHQTSGTKAGYTVSSRKLSNKPQASNSDVTLQSGSMNNRGKSYNFPKGTLFTQLPGGIFAKHPRVPETHPGYGHLIKRSEDNINQIHSALNNEQGVAEAVWDRHSQSHIPRDGRTFGQTNHPREEHCDSCGAPTGHAGPGEDSNVDDNGNVYCDDCYADEQGVAEGLGKNIKRAAQGWGGAQDNPADIVKRNKSYDTDTAKKVRAHLDDAPDHTPAGLQKRVLDRKLKGVAEGLKDTVKQKAKEFGKYMTEPDTPHQAVVRDRAKNIDKIRKNKEQGVAEAGYPEVDHMPGLVNKYNRTPAKPTSSKKIYTDKKQWLHDVDEVNHSVYDDNSEYIGQTGRSTVTINDREWARWSDAQQKGYIDMGSMSESHKEADYGDDYQSMVTRVGQKAKLGPLQTVYDPQKRVYKNVPVSDTPKQSGILKGLSK